MDYGDIIHSSMRYLALDVDFPYAEMLGEARRASGRFVPHREREEGTQAWYALVLHGMGEHMSLGYESYGVTAEQQGQYYRWTEAAEVCPITTRYFREVFPANQYGRIRFMLLKPRGVVPFHSDYPESKLASISMALNNPGGVRFLFRADGRTEEVPFRPGAAFALNLSYPHSVINESDEDRFHIIVHPLRSTPAYRDLICRSYRRSQEPAGSE